MGFDLSKWPHLLHKMGFVDSLTHRIFFHDKQQLEICWNLSKNFLPWEIFRIYSLRANLLNLFNFRLCWRHLWNCFGAVRQQSLSKWCTLLYCGRLLWMFLRSWLPWQKMWIQIQRLCLTTLTKVRKIHSMIIRVPYVNRGSSLSTILTIIVVQFTICTKLSKILQVETNEKFGSS